jgi:hypothetical protein
VASITGDENAFVDGKPGCDPLANFVHQSEVDQMWYIKGGALM